MVGLQIRSGYSIYITQKISEVVFDIYNCNHFLPFLTNVENLYADPDPTMKSKSDHAFGYGITFPFLDI